MDISDALKLAGLTKQESLIYKGLLESGPETVAVIARNAGLHRPVVYKFLPRLQEKGLIHEVKKGKSTYFVAESPDKLSYLFDSMTGQFKDAVSELKDLQTKDGKPIVKFYEGKEGIRGVFYDMVSSLKKGELYYRYTSSRGRENDEKYLPANYRKIRDSKKLERFVISNVKRAAQKKPRMERAMRLVPPEFDLFEDDVTLLMYQDKVAYIDYNTETATVIQNKMIAIFQIKIFKLLYSRL